MQDVIIHIGLPKCASTTLQLKYFNNNRHLYYLGGTFKAVKQSEAVLRFIDEVNSLPSQDSPEIKTDNIYYASLIYKKNLKEILANQYDQTFVKTFFKKYIEDDISGDQKLIVSNEGFSVGVLVSPLETAERLHTAFSNAKILVILRNPLEWLKSEYLQMYRGIPKKIDKLPGFSQWLNLHYLGKDGFQSVYYQLRWNRLLECYSGLFGKENVKVLLFEQFVKERERFIGELSDFIGVNLSDFERENIDEHFNPSLTKGDYLLKRMLPGKLNFLVNRYSVGLVNKIFGKKIKLKMDTEMQKKTLSYMQPVLSVVGKEWGLPLKQFGYPVK